MVKSWYTVGIALAVVLLLSRGEANEPPGELTSLDMEVHVFRPDGSPAVNEPILTAETMVGLVVTGVGRADERGVFKLRGDYCLPMIVSTEKGAATIGVGGLRIFTTEKGVTKSVAGRSRDISIFMKEPGMPFTRQYHKIVPPDPDQLQDWRRECFHY